MDIDTKIDLTFDELLYSINAKRICYVLSKLSGSNVAQGDVDKICNLIKYYHLDKKEILDKINEI